MEPFAYGLRDHPFSRSPRPCDRFATEPLATPEAFQHEVAAPKIDVLALLRDPKGERRTGWCTYTFEAEGAPEVEVLCGGVNHKSAQAGAVWRQGNLLHFGFEPSPERLSDAGQALLVNAVCYAARFTEDRPVVRTPCVFVEEKRIIDRGALARLLKRPESDWWLLEYYASAPLFAELKGKSRNDVADWYRQARPYLRADTDGRLTVDAEAQALGVGPSAAGFFEKVLPLRSDAERGERARQLLRRYAPDGPAADAPVAAWESWLKENRPYLFFSDLADYRWLIDPLAKKRRVPTAELRGPARATLPPIETTGRREPR